MLLKWRFKEKYRRKISQIFQTLQGPTWKGLVIQYLQPKTLSVHSHDSLSIPSVSTLNYNLPTSLMGWSHCESPIISEVKRLPVKCKSFPFQWRGTPQDNSSISCLNMIFRWFLSPDSSLATTGGLSSRSFWTEFLKRLWTQKCLYMLPCQEHTVMYSVLFFISNVKGFVVILSSIVHVLVSRYKNMHKGVVTH